MDIFNNRYVQLGVLTVLIGLVIWAIVWTVLFALGLSNFPVALQLALAFLGAGLLVAKFLAGRIF